MQEPISLGMWVTYSGPIPQRAGSDHVGIVVGRREEDGLIQISAVAPGKIWLGAQAFPVVFAAPDSLQPLKAKHRVGEAVVYAVREDELANSVMTTPRDLGMACKEAVFDDETESTKIVTTRRRPAVEGKTTIHYGSVYKAGQTAFAALIVRPHENGSADIILLVPGRLEPVLIRNVTEGPEPGQFMIAESDSAPILAIAEAHRENHKGPVEMPFAADAKPEPGPVQPEPEPEPEPETKAETGFSALIFDEDVKDFHDAA